MRKEDRVIAAAASAAKHKAGQAIDATAGLAVATANEVAAEVEKAGEMIDEAGAALKRAGDTVKHSGERSLKLAE